MSEPTPDTNPETKKEMPTMNNIDRRKTYVLELDETEQKWFDRSSLKVPGRPCTIPPPPAPSSGIDDDDSFVDGWFR